ncbi:MAG: ABC transporter permease [Microbacteriaceae bacterium]
MTLHSGLAGFVLRRIALCALSAVAVAVLVFFAIRAIPGDPALTLIGDTGTEADYLALRASMGLDRPLPVQFAIWVGQIIGGDLGFSYAQARPVGELVGPAALNSLRLGAVAAVVAIVLALVLGNLATSGSRLARRLADGIEAFFLSAPQYTVALLALILFAVTLKWFPVSGTQSIGGGDPLDVLHHLALPAVSLALTPAAHMARSLKTSIAGLRESDLLPSLLDRGLAPWRVAVHVHHNALPPMLTVLGIQVGSILGGTIFIETLFSIPGLGSLLVYSVGVRDYATVQIVAFFVALVYVVVMFATDLVNAIIDPRIRVAVR